MNESKNPIASLGLVTGLLFSLAVAMPALAATSGYVPGPLYGEEYLFFLRSGSGAECARTASRVSAATQSLLAIQSDAYHNPLNLGMPSSEQAASVLNWWLGDNFYYYWPRHRDDSLQAFIDNVKYGIDARYPVVVNLRIDPEDPRPPNYPSRTASIYHYVTVVGYSNDGNTLRVLDPAAEGGANGVLPDDWNNVMREWYWPTGLISDLMYTGYAAGDYPDFVPGMGAGGAAGAVPPPPGGGVGQQSDVPAPKSVPTRQPAIPMPNTRILGGLINE